MYLSNLYRPQPGHMRLPIWNRSDCTKSLSQLRHLLDSATWSSVQYLPSQLRVFRPPGRSLARVRFSQEDFTACIGLEEVERICAVIITITNFDFARHRHQAHHGRVCPELVVTAVTCRLLAVRKAWTVLPLLRKLSEDCTNQAMKDLRTFNSRPSPTSLQVCMTADEKTKLIEL